MKVIKKAIILANGKPPVKSVIKHLQKIGYNILICADGGANAAYRMKLIPDFIIGDLDSVEDEVLQYYCSSSVIKKIKRQNDTDVEKCLKFCISNNIKDVILTGVTGDRLDHSLCNLGIVLKFFKKLIVKIVAENSFLVPYSGNIEISTLPGETISLYGFNKETLITSVGLKYPLKNIALPFGEKESTSNIAVKDKIKLKIKGQTIFIIRDIKTLFKYGFI